jgi:hypothetical protein
MRIVAAMSPFNISLLGEGLSELAERYSASALQLCKLAAALALNDNDEDSLHMVATYALYTKRSPTGDAVDFAQEMIGKIKDEEIKQNAQYLVDHSIRGYRGERIEGLIETTHRQVYENMATSLGVNLNDVNDPISNIIQIGINDLDPSRILKNCEHFFVTLSARGLVAEILALPTAGHKVLHCDLHEYAIEGLTLDKTYQSFKKRYCDRCPDCLPRQSDWRYSEEWQQEENKKHVEYMRRFAKRTGINWEDGKG